MIGSGELRHHEQAGDGGTVGGAVKKPAMAMMTGGAWVKGRCSRPLRAMPMAPPVQPAMTIDGPKSARGAAGGDGAGAGRHLSGRAIHRQ